MTNSEPSIIFFHIPKAGGTTLHKIIDKQYDSSVIYTLDGNQTQKSASEFKHIALEQRMKYKILKGHMWMELRLHEYMPQPCTYITILRDPVDRAMSFYYYILQTPSHYLYEEVALKKLSLQDFVQSGCFPPASDGQFKLLAHNLDNIVGNPLEIAQHNLLKYFSLVGILEKFDEFLLLAQKMFGWKNIYYTRLNITGNRPSKSDLSDKTLSILEEYNQFDMQLYKFAEQKMSELIGQQRPAFEQSVSLFRQTNELIEKVEKESAVKLEVIHKLRESLKQACEAIYKTGGDTQFLVDVFGIENIVFGTEEASGLLRSGWSYNEKLIDEGLTANWALGDSASLFLALPKDKPVRLTAHIKSLEFSDPQIITIQVDGKVIGKWSLSNKWQWERHDITINPNDHRPGVSIITFDFSKNLTMEDDLRSLAVLFESLSIYE